MQRRSQTSRPVLTRNAGPRSCKKHLKTFLTVLAVVVVVVQLCFVHYYAQKQQQHWQHEHIEHQLLSRRRHQGNGAHRSQNLVASDNGVNKNHITPQNEYIMWSKDESYTRQCNLHIKGNETWGRLHAPLVDKIASKEIITKKNIPKLKIIPTLAVLDKNNVTQYSLEFMQSIPQPYIIKATHVSGGVARVYNNTFHCFKYCESFIPSLPIPLDANAFNYSKLQILEDINLDYSTLGNELQYKYITPHIIFEQDIITGGKTNTDVTFWWLSNGVPLFVSQQCGRPRKGQQGFQMERIFVDATFRRTPILFNRPTCPNMVEKPKSWETQLEIMNRLGELFPGEVVRIDVYGGGDDVWFSEFTFTTAGCWRTFQPQVTDGLLHAIAQGQISPENATPDFVQSILNDESWVSVSFDEKNNQMLNFTGAYPSPVDLCSMIEELANKRERNILFETCMEEAKMLESFPLRCIVTENKATKFHSFAVLENELPSVDVPTPVDICARKHQQGKQQ